MQDKRSLQLASLMLLLLILLVYTHYTSYNRLKTHQNDIIEYELYMLERTQD